MKKLLFSILFSSTCSYAQAQSTSFQWAGAINGKENQEAKSVTTDASGNVITVGYYVDSTDLDPTSSSIFVIPSPDKSAEDIFVNKLDASGNLVWSKSITGGKYKRANKVVTDASGNIYITGGFCGTTDFDPSSAVFNLTAASTLVHDVFVMKLNADGTFGWAVMLKNGPIGTGIDDAKSIKVDASGNVYIVGEFRGKIDFDPSTTGTNIIDATPGANAFILKLDNSGNYVKVVNIENPTTSISDISGIGLGVDASGNMYISGLFNNVVDFDPSAAEANITAVATSGNMDVFLAKYDASGNYVWAKSISGTDIKKLGSMVADNAGNTYLTGSFRGACSFGTSSLTAAEYADIFVAKYDASGTNVWAKQFIGGNTIINGGNDIALDAVGNVYTTGGFVDATDFDPGAGTAILNNVGGFYNAFISKLDATGNYVWCSQIGNNSLGTCIGYGISVDASNNVLTCGQYDGPNDFDFGSATVTLNHLGRLDAYVHKISQAVSAISEAKSMNEVSIYPNPNNGIFTIETSLVSNNNSIEVFNIFGQLVYRQKAIAASTLVDISNQASGVYFVKITSEGQHIATQKIMKQ